MSNWVADAGWTAASGVSAASSIAAITNSGEVPQAIYQTRRNGKVLTYHLAIPDGTYQVRLHFAELYWTAAGKRKFKVSIEGQPVLTNLDIFAAAGGKNRALVRTFENIVVSGGLQIQGVASVDSAQFNGIEVWPAGASPKRALKTTAPTATVDAQPVAPPAPKSIEPSLDSWPVAVARGSDTDWTAAPNLVDGDTNTLWIGNAGASSWSLVLDFEESLPLDNLDILFAGEPWPEVGLMGTDNLREWFDLEQISIWPVPCRAVYIYLNGRGAGSAPAIREILWESDLPF